MKRVVSVLVAASLAGCGTVTAVKQTVGLAPKDTGPRMVTGFLGGAIADEPRAALAAKQVLLLGGNAADAAVALGFMLSVTLPSRAGLGGGGACVAWQPGEKSPNHGQPEAILFPPASPAVQAGDRPAAVPLMARGYYLLSARYGSLPIAQLIAPAEEAARFGVGVSRALARDLAVVARPLAADPAAGEVFAPGGAALGEGAKLVQADLAATLTNIRTVGIGDAYQGYLAHRLEAASAEAGGPITVNDLRASHAVLSAPVASTLGDDQVASTPVPPASAGILPASTGFVVVDNTGGAVACALTMNNLFGTGRVAPGTGMVLAASPAAKPAALLPAALVWNANLHAFRAAVAASGQAAAPAALQSALSAALSGGEVTPADPGRANVAVCPRYLPGEPALCRFTADPRLAGLAATGG